MTDLESLIVIDTAEPDNRIAVHPRLWNALVREVIAARAYDKAWGTHDHFDAEDDYTKARAETDAALSAPPETSP